jgi:PIN domain nuclease of toxin-antitoxin system
MPTQGILLDTHVWLWLELGEDHFTAAQLRQLNAAAVNLHLFVSAISLLEVANLHRRGRVTLPIPLDSWFEQTLTQAGISLLQITPKIAVETALLPEEFHGDPADRLIASTARVENLTLCTHDKSLLSFGKKGLYRTMPV